MPDSQSDSHGLTEDVKRLREDLDEAREHQRATSEVLSVLASSLSDLAPVFKTVVENATRLCRADMGQIFISDGALYSLAFALGGSSEYRALLSDTPIAPGRGTLVGKVAAERRTIHIPDVLADEDYQWRDALRLGGQRTMLGVPMVGEDEVIGVVSLVRTEVDPFTDRQIDLVTTFAAQAAIAIQHARLFGELEDRSVELSRSVEELRALNEVGEAVSSTLELTEVLNAIVTQAVKLSGTDGGSIFEFDPETEEFRLSTAFGTSDELVEALRATHIRLGETAVGRAAATRETQKVPDITVAPQDPHLEQLLQHGWRSMLAVPLLRENRILGALVVRRRTPGDFSADTENLLETFASQSALTVQNAQLFRELAHQSHELEVASRHKSEFLASMSHELRTPLNAVIGFSEVLLEGMFGDVNEKQSDYLEDIRNSGRHLLELINEILDLSKIEAGRMELEPTPFSLVSALEDGLRMVRDRASQKSIELSLELDPRAGTIVADELKVKQVVLNLLTNAVKFTDPGGKVELKARQLDAEAEVTVHDTGIGIAEADQTRIFESFQQGGRDTKGEEGTGLGLTLCKKIVELHGGELWVKSQPGAGSTFGFSIPTRLGHVVGPAVVPEAPAASDTGAAPTILLIEDDQPSIDLVSLHLRHAGFDVAVARDGAEGLELIRTLRPDGIVLDIVLPGLDGWDVLASIKADPDVANIPVIIVSMLNERGKGFALGAAEYLVKPVGRDDLAGAFQRCFRLHGGGRKILAIDDDPRAIELIEAVLEPEGYAVLTATGGEEGVALAAREQPAVILLDLLMPDLDGFAAVERLRADPTTAEIPIVIVTAKTMTASDKERLNGQISCLVEKGAFERATFLDLVRQFSRPATVS